MKARFILIFTIILLYLSCSVKKTIHISSKENMLLNEDKYKIIKIDSINSIYILYVKRNDSVLKVVSIKKVEEKCDRVKVGERYSLNLKSYFSTNIYQKLDVAGFKVDETIIKLEGNGVIRDLFSTKNLCGLCYVEYPCEVIPIAPLK